MIRNQLQPGCAGPKISMRDSACLRACGALLFGVLTVNTTHNKCRAYVPLVSEKVLSQHCDCSAHTAFPSSVEPMQRQVRAHHLRHILAISRGSSPTAKNVGCEVVNLFAILICYDRALSCTSVRPKNNTILRRRKTFRNLSATTQRCQKPQAPHTIECLDRTKPSLCLNRSIHDTAGGLIMKWNPNHVHLQQAGSTLMANISRMGQHLGTATREAEIGEHLNGKTPARTDTQSIAPADSTLRSRHTLNTMPEMVVPVFFAFFIMFPPLSFASSQAFLLAHNIQLHLNSCKRT